MNHIIYIWLFLFNKQNQQKKNEGPLRPRPPKRLLKKQLLESPFSHPIFPIATPWVPPEKPLGFFFLHSPLHLRVLPNRKYGHCHPGLDQPTPPRDSGVFTSYSTNKHKTWSTEFKKKKTGERKRFIFDWQVYKFFDPPVLIFRWICIH